MATNSAKVTVTGTPENPVFNFELPSGAKGERGLQGDRGVVGPTPQLKMGQVNTLANPSDAEWIAGMIRKSSVVTAALSETFPSTMKGDKGEPGGFTVSSLGTADLNTIVTSGVYRQNSGANATPALNYPRNNDAGTLLVTLWGGTNEVVQEYNPYPINGTTVGKWVRGFRGSTWSPWRFIPTQTVTADASGHKTVSTYDGNGNVDIPLAGPGGWTVPATVWSTTDANSLTTPGVYYQTSGSTLALNWPGLLKGHMFVTGVPGSVHQEFAPWTGMTATTSKTRFVRDQLTATTWSPWTVFATQRIDNTVGRAIYTWDDTTNREQLIYGDTGWRDLSSLIPEYKSGIVYMRRSNYKVELLFEVLQFNTVPSNRVITMKNALPSLNSVAEINLPLGGAAASQTTLHTFNASWGGNHQLKLGTGSDAVSGYVTYPTRSAWPTTPIGTTAYDASYK